jgi:hypothetical protein
MVIWSVRLQIGPIESTETGLIQCGATVPPEWRHGTLRLATVGQRRGEIHLRHHAAQQLRRGVAICAGTDVAAVSPHPRRAGSARGGRGGGVGHPVQINNVPDSELAAQEEKIKNIQHAARESLAKAEAIENAAYDLKAVNPNRVVLEDQRTPTELLKFINVKGQEADAALKALRNLVTLSHP